MELDPQDVVYTNGEIIGPGSSPPAQAIFIRSGRIVSVGSNADVLNVAGDSIPRIDLKGAVVIPGLIDTHPHLLHFAAFKANQLDITDTKNHTEILDAIRTHASSTPKGEWIMTSPVGELHWFHKRSAKDLEEGGLPNRHVLDQATADHPVMIQALAPRNPNIIAFNSTALGILEITSSTPGRVNNVWIEKDKDGEPTGVLRGSVTAYYNQDPFFLSVLDRLPPLVQPERIPPALVAAMESYNAMGITTIYEGHAIEFEHIQGYQAMKDHNALSLRVKACPELEPKALGSEPDLTTSEITSNLEKAYGMRTVEDDWLRIDGITACTYGPCCTGHGLVKKGYLSPSGEATTGKRVVSEENLRVAFDFCGRTGLPLNLCSITPDEHDEHFTMTRETLQKHHLAKTNWIMQHGMLIRADQIQQLAELGFDMTVSSAFTYGEGEIYRARIGPEALEILNPYRQLLDAGLNVAASMDWGPTNPFEQMELAVSHTMYPSRESNAGPQQVVTRAEAFEMWTKHGAKVLRWPQIGTLAVGNYADLAVVDRNPITCRLADLPDTKVLRTLVGGRVVFDKGLLPFV